jgi:hypothetical protein
MKKLTDKDVEQAAKDHYYEEHELLGDQTIGDVRRESFLSGFKFANRDEYAEEYAKAFFQWQRLSSAFYVSPDEAVEAFKNSAFFKESLKK